MGYYQPSSRKHGGNPVYENGSGSFLYKSSESGKWAVCDDEDHIDRNWARIRSTESAERPTRRGLRWRYDAGVVASSFKEDPAITCVSLSVPHQVSVRVGLPPPAFAQHCSVGVGGEGGRGTDLVRVCEAARAGRGRGSGEGSKATPKPYLFEISVQNQWNTPSIVPDTKHMSS